jgi:hypothetical protein
MSAIFVTGLNTCSPRKRSGHPLASARRATDSEEVQLAEQPRLDVMILDHGLDDECRLRQLLWVGDDLHVLRVDLHFEPAERLLDCRARAVG